LKRESKMSSFRFRSQVSLAFVALCWGQGQAIAGDLEECLGRAVERIEAACTAILNDVERPTEDRVKAYGARSRFFNARGKFDAGLADAEAALQLNPQSVGALLSRAYAHQRTGNFDAALADYNHALELEPKNPSVLASRAGLRIDQKAWSEALADLDQAIALRQDYAQAYVARARVHVEIAQLDQALSDLNAALSMNSTVQNAFFWRGQVYRRKGDVDRAIDDFSRADSSSSPRVTMPAPLPISTRCCRSRPMTRPLSSNARQPWRCRPNLPRCTTPRSHRRLHPR
jgi:tetratricopeptide (TPR) repeat protein